MVDRPRTLRFALLVVALCALVGLFVWFATVEPDPERNHYPDGDDLGGEYDAHVGDRVAVGGTIVASDPAVLEVDHAHGTSRYELRNPPAVEEGQYVRVYATARPDYELVVDDAVVIDGWERQYMYGISILAALWVAARTARQWRFDANRLGFVPRTDSASSTAGDGRSMATADGGDRDG